jgi:hypothetical protein
VPEPGSGRPDTIAVMSKSASTSKSGAERLKALPWAVLLQAGVVVGQRWKGLSEKERARLIRLVRESGGRIGNLSAKDRAELRKLAGKLDVTGLGRDLLPLVRGQGFKRRGRGSK